MQPSPLVVSEGFDFVEGMLQESVQYVPVAECHKDVYSPRYATIILEAASLFDSVLKSSCQLTGKQTKKDLRIGDYLSQYGQLLVDQWVVFFGSQFALKATPFVGWRGSTFKPHEAGQFKLEWWEAYSGLKHNRLEHLNLATQWNAISAVSSLLLAMIYSGNCDYAIHVSNWYAIGSPPPKREALMREMEALNLAIVETKLFSHPIGWHSRPPVDASLWGFSASRRFVSWWGDYAKEHANQNAKAGGQEA